LKKINSIDNEKRIKVY